MNLSMKWLADYLDFSVSPKEYADRMTMSGSKVEGWKAPGEEIKRVVVGKIETIDRHPDADKLVVCQVDVGESEPIQIVTGAPNLTEGDLVPVALHGSTLPGGKKITKGKLRGVLSNGMLCSLSELGLTQNDFPYAVEDGIFVLAEKCQPGDDIVPLLGLDDVAVEFEITSNRPDCLSIIGLARETAATFNLPLTINEPNVKGCGDSVEAYLDVTVENTTLCPRYMARVVKNIKIAPSPLWMRERLRTCGVRPINNLVDITNYVMLEYGQPMHAFDHRFVTGGKIIVRNAKPDETITTLDEQKRVLAPSMLVIADEKAPTAIAGVMGGQFSSIGDDTQVVVFESACFAGPSVRLTAKALGMRTESSGRYEKGLDPANCAPALARACELIELLGAGEVVDGVIDVDHSDHSPLTIPLLPQWTNDFLGLSIPTEKMISILETIGFTVKDNLVTVPSFRAGDVQHKADLAEEIARFYGYDLIPTTILRGVADGQFTPYQKLTRTVANTMVALGGCELTTYTFTSPANYDKILLPGDSPLRNFVRIANPLGEERSVMRTLILPSMMDSLARNYNNRAPAASLFEIGTVYAPVAGGQPMETDHLAIGLYGATVDFFVLKGMIESLMDALRIKNYTVFADSTKEAYHPGRCASITIGDVVLGHFGQIHPTVAENYEMNVPVYTATLDMALLSAHAQPVATYQQLPKYPAMTRDLALVCDQKKTAASLEEIIKQAGKPMLENLTLFDVYEGEHIAAHQKSLAFRLVFRSQEATLTDQEVDRKIRDILEALLANGVTLRS